MPFSGKLKKTNKAPIGQIDQPGAQENKGGYRQAQPRYIVVGEVAVTGPDHNTDRMEGENSVERHTDNRSVYHHLRTYYVAA